MKKILLLFIIFPTLAFAGSDDVKKSGFLKKPISTKVDKLEIAEPKNKIIIILRYFRENFKLFCLYCVI